MSNFPNNYDNDVTLPAVNNNITEIGEESINALREAVLNIETNIGLNANGSENNIASRLNVALNNDGTIKTSILAASGLVTLPISNTHVSDTAAIREYKLDLDYKTSDLFNYIKDLSNDVNSVAGWINTDGINLNPHLDGSVLRHTLDHIDVSTSSSNFFKNKNLQFRDNTNSFTALKDLNDDFVLHQRSDGVQNNASSVTTVNGESFPGNYGHTASAIFVDPSRFAFLPQTTNDVQKLVNYLDSSSIFLYGTRIQNLYSNGISRNSRASSLSFDGYGLSVVPETTVTAYLLNNGLSGDPVDDILIGDDLIRFYPDSSVLSNKKFHNQFSSVKAGDVLRINYGGLQTSFIIKEKKYINNDLNSVFIVRVNGRNLKHTTNGIARIDRSLVNENKYATLGVTAVNNDFYVEPSLLVINPRCAQTLGNGFNPNHITSSNYLLYLALFTNGNLDDGYTLLPGIDVTGNFGKTPGKYTLESIVDSTNKAFRSLGFNYRFAAFNYNGEFGLAMTDTVNNAGFSIISGVVNDNGLYDQTESNNAFPNNVIDLFSSIKKDPLGLGPNGSGSASPPYQNSYGTAEMSLVYTKLFLPLKRNTYYVNGSEKDNLQLDVNQIQDSLGDGYWVATVTSVDVLSNRVKTIYRIDLDLSQSKLDIGSTILVKSNFSIANDGRYIVEDININCPPNAYTEIVVYDAVHANGSSPATTLPVSTVVNIYFNSESITFNKANSSDFTEQLIYKRLFETYVDENGLVFNHERSRFIITGSSVLINEGIVLNTNLEVSKLNIVNISPKLSGYSFGSVNKITIKIVSYDTISSTFNAYLCNFDGYNETKKGPTIVGKKGSLVRLFDYSRIDYIDIQFNLDDAVSAIFNSYIDVQLFSSLENNKQLMLLSTCQLNDVSRKLTHFRDKRQFGNISEENLTTSALNYISAGDKILHSNGVVRGFEYVLTGTNIEVISGGVAVVNGKIVQMNSETIVIPAVKEWFNSQQHNILFALCLNDNGQYVTIGLLDSYEEFLTVGSVTRTMNVYDPVSGNTYPIECDTFENMVNYRKDIIPLYIVYVSTSLATVIDTIDVRKYCLNSDSFSPLVYTNSDSFGNFKKASAMFSWLQFNNNKHYQAYISNVTETITDPVRVDYNSVVTIDGRGSTSLIFNSGSYPATRAIPLFGSNAIIKNINFDGSTKFEFINSSTNLEFNNCSFNLVDNSLFDFVSNTNIKFLNCTFEVNINSVTHVSVFKFTQCNNIIFDKCSFISNSSQYSATLMSFVDSSDITITNCSFEGNFTTAINLYKTTKTNIENNSFIWSKVVANLDSFTSDASLGLVADLFYTNRKNNFIRALILCTVENEISDIIINNNTMSFTQITDLRLGFISFIFNTTLSGLINSEICYNKFYHINSGTTYETRPIISLIGTVQGFSTTKAPKIMNVKIDNNYSNRDQMIIISSIETASGIAHPGLSTQNVSVSRNTCGIIGYAISNKNTSVSGNNEINSNLLIDSNNCKLISTCNYYGTRHYSTSSSGGFQRPLGNVSIINNNCSWITVSLQGEFDDSLIISNNKLNARNYDFETFDQAALGHSGQPTSGTGRYAIRVTCRNANTAFSSPEMDPCVITGNIINQGTYMNDSNTYETYYYQQGFIYVKCRAVISNNILRGIDPVGTDYNLIFSNGYNAVITNNIIHGPNPTATYKYVYAANPSNGLVSSGLIKDNHFYPSSTGYDGDESFISVPSGGNWRAYENVNQICYAIIPLTDGLRYGGGLDLGSPAFPMLYNGSLAQPKFIGSHTGGLTTNSDFGIGVANSNINTPLSASLEYYGAKSDVLRIRYMLTTFGYSMEVAFQKNLKHVVPVGCKIKSVSIGMRRFGGLTVSALDPAFNTRFNLNLYDYNDGYTSNTLTDLNRFADGYAKDNSFPITTTNTISITGSELNSSSSTIVKSVNVNNVTVTNKETLVSLAGHITISNPLEIFISPIVIKYTW